MSAPPYAPPANTRAPAAAWPRRGSSDGTAARTALSGRRRSVPHLAIGALLVVACALGFAVTAARVDHRHPVLVLARPVAVGQIITAGDLRVVQVAAGPELSTIPGRDSASVIGQSAGLSLPAGTLLTRNAISGAASLPAGDAIIAVALKPGQFPPDLVRGAHVIPVLTATTAGGGSSASLASSSWSATVTSVQTLDNQQGSVVSLQLPRGQAQQLAGLPDGQVNLVVVSGAG